MPSRELAAIELMLHELRTPLNVLTGSLAQIAAAPSASGTDTAALDRARRACDRLEVVLQQARQWTRRLASPATGSTLLSPVLADAMRSAVAARGRGVESHLDAALPDVAVALSVDALSEVVRALLDAIFRAADDGASIPVAAHVASQDSRFVTLTIGSAADAQSSGAFDAEWLGGHGFSLPLAHAIVRSASGEIWATSVGGRLVGAGVRLPVA